MDASWVSDLLGWLFGSFKTPGSIFGDTNPTCPKNSAFRCQGKTAVTAEPPQKFPQKKSDTPPQKP